MKGTIKNVVQLFGASLPYGNCKAFQYSESESLFYYFVVKYAYKTRFDASIEQKTILIISTSKEEINFVCKTSKLKTQCALLGFMQFFFFNNNNIFISYIKYTNITPPANSKANQGRWCCTTLISMHQHNTHQDGYVIIHLSISPHCLTINPYMRLSSVATLQVTTILDPMSTKILLLAT